VGRRHEVECTGLTFNTVGWPHSRAIGLRSTLGRGWSKDNPLLKQTAPLAGGWSPTSDYDVLDAGAAVELALKRLVRRMSVALVLGGLFAAAIWVLVT
jgi:hypothetical protein